jgi:hypothetical protein
MSPDDAYALLVRWSPIIGGFGAFALPFLYSLVKDAKTRRIEAQKPHLERQLQLYTETCQLAVCLATAEDPQQVTIAKKRFWELYWGELCMVENRGVEKAMVQLGKALESNASQDELKNLSYELAHALRHSLEVAWGFRLRRMLPY